MCQVRGTVTRNMRKNYCRIWKRFAIVFNDTVFGNIINAGKAFENLCEMAEDICIINCSSV